MLRDEFEQLTGFWPMEHEWREIEAQYMASDLDKHAWCQNWLDGGGIGTLVAARARRIEGMEVAIQLLKKKSEQYREMLARCYHHLPGDNPFRTIIATDLGGLANINKLSGDGGDA